MRSIETLSVCFKSDPLLTNPPIRLVDHNCHNSGEESQTGHSRPQAKPPIFGRLRQKIAERGAQRPGEDIGKPETKYRVYPKDIGQPESTDDSREQYAGRKIAESEFLSDEIARG